MVLAIRYFFGFILGAFGVFYAFEAVTRPEGMDWLNTFGKIDTFLGYAVAAVVFLAVARLLWPRSPGPRSRAEREGWNK